MPTAVLAVLGVDLIVVVALLGVILARRLGEFGAFATIDRRSDRRRT
jgi:hypothetical protein